MLWRISLCCGLLLGLLSGYAIAGDPQVISPIKTGEAAPGDGFYVPAERFRELMEQAKDYRVLIEVYDLEVTSLRKQLTTSRDFALAEEKIRHEAEIAKLQLDIDEYRKRLAAAENPPFWRTNEFHRFFGMAIGMITVLILKPF